jgi:hypothetical protein
MPKKRKKPSAPIISTHDATSDDLKIKREESTIPDLISITMPVALELCTEAPTEIFDTSHTTKSEEEDECKETLDTVLATESDSDSNSTTDEFEKLEDSQEDTTSLHDFELIMPEQQTCNQIIPIQASITNAALRSLYQHAITATTTAINSVTDTTTVAAPIILDLSRQALENASVAAIAAVPIVEQGAMITYQTIKGITTAAAPIVTEVALQGANLVKHTVITMAPYAKEAIRATAVATAHLATHIAESINTESTIRHKY